MVNDSFDAHLGRAINRKRTMNGRNNVVNVLAVLGALIVLVGVSFAANDALAGELGTHLNSGYSASV